MFGNWLRKQRIKARREETRQKIEHSSFSAELYREVMQDSPAYIGFSDTYICWDDKYDQFKRPAHKIVFSERGYRSLHSCDPENEVDALMDYFIARSGTAYTRSYNGPDGASERFNWPYYVLVSRASCSSKVQIKEW